MSRALQALAIIGVGVAALAAIHSPTIWPESMSFPLWIRLGMTVGVMLAFERVMEKLLDSRREQRH